VLISYREGDSGREWRIVQTGAIIQVSLPREQPNMGSPSACQAADDCHLWSWRLLNSLTPTLLYDERCSLDTLPFHSHVSLTCLALPHHLPPSTARATTTNELFGNGLGILRASLVPAQLELKHVLICRLRHPSPRRHGHMACSQPECWSSHVSTALTAKKINPRHDSTNSE